MLTRDLAEFVATTRLDDVPQAALAAAKDALVDTLSCALGGLGDDAARIALDYALSSQAAPQCRVWGREARTSPADAAFANGVASHVLDYDDSLPILRGHPSTTILPAAVAVAETLGSSGAELLAAYAFGVELAGTIGPALGYYHYGRGWHSTATVGVFAATAACGRLMGLSPTRLRAAWGLAGAECAGLLRNFGSLAKRFPAAQAARGGVAAAWLASRGMTADENIFEGPGGFLEAYGEEGAADCRASLGQPWKILQPGIYVKRWPCCYANHRPLAGVLELVKNHAITADEVIEIGCGFMPHADKALIHTQPYDGLSGKFSIEYVAAAAVLDGRIDLASFEDAMVTRPRIAALMPKVRRVPMAGEGHFSGVVGSTDVSITTTRGTFSTHVAHTPGSPELPMTAADREEKFLGCATGLLGAARAREVFALAQRVGELDDVRMLTAALVA